MFGLGGWEIMLLVVAGLLFFGPKKLPQLMRQAGKVMHEVKKASSEFQYSIERELDDDEFRRAHKKAKKKAKKLQDRGIEVDEHALMRAEVDALGPDPVPANAGGTESEKSGDSPAQPAGNGANASVPGNGHESKAPAGPASAPATVPDAPARPAAGVVPGEARTHGDESKAGRG